MTIEIKRIETEEYEKLLEDLTLDEASLFHKSTWLNTVSEAFCTEKVLVKCLKGDKVLAIIPLMKKQRFIFSFYGSPLSGLYSDHTGILFRKDISREQKTEIVNTLTKWLIKRADYLEFHTYREINKEIYKPIISKSFNLENKNTLIIDLQKGKDIIWESFSGRARTEIRKAKKNSIEVKEEVPNSDWSLKFYSMLEKTFQRRGEKSPHPFFFFDNLEKIHKNGCLKIFSAYKDKAFVASAVFLVDRNRMIYSSGTSNIIGMKNSANSLIQWTAINKAISMGLDIYDLGGTGIESIDRFKRSFSKQETHNIKWIYRSKLIQLIEPIARLMARKGLIRF